jgi:hypothetical protein
MEVETMRRAGFRHIRLAMAMGVLVAASAAATSARADEAVVTVGRVDDSRFARPAPIASQPIVPDDDPHEFPRPELHRAPLRLQLAPTAITSGKGVGGGLQIAADFGTGTVGGRLAAAWMRGEGHAADSGYPLGDSVGQYTGEITLDLHKRGALHPVIGIGFGLAHVSRPTGSGNAGIGTGRLGLDYALPVEDADVRVGVHATGVMTGPSDDEIKDLHGYGLVAAVLSIGF